jgi:hypothetical protein
MALEAAAAAEAALPAAAEAALAATTLTLRVATLRPTRLPECLRLYVLAIYIYIKQKNIKS